jgi:5-methylthioadenosine/S-adenosylhomocysteine deaminase
VLFSIWDYGKIIGMKNDPGILIKGAVRFGEVVDVRIRDGLFSEIAPNLSPLPDETVLDARGMAIVPAFYNLHGHAAMSLMRGYADDMELFKWLNEYVWPFEAKMTGEDIYNGTRLAILEMIKSGTVHFEDMYWFPLDAARAAKEMGIRARIGLLTLSNNSNANKLNRECLERIDEFRGRVKIAYSPHAVYTVNEKTLREVVETSERFGLNIHIHCSETEKEVADCIGEHGLTPTAWLMKLGILRENTLLAHCVHLTDEDIDLIAESGSVAVHVPLSNLKLASGVFPYARIRERGAKVALGTDGCCSSNDLSMFGVMRGAAYLAKGFHNDTTIAPASEIFSFATRQGALAAGVDGGFVEVGKAADCLLINTDIPCLVPNYSLVSNLVYSASPECVDTVICDGRIIMKGRKVEGEEEIVAKARESVKRLAGR